MCCCYNYCYGCFCCGACCATTGCYCGCATQGICQCVGVDGTIVSGTYAGCPNTCGGQTTTAPCAYPCPFCSKSPFYCSAKYGGTCPIYGGYSEVSCPPPTPCVGLPSCLIKCNVPPNQSKGSGTAGSTGGGSGTGGGAGGGGKPSPSTQAKPPQQLVTRRVPCNTSGLLNNFLSAFSGARVGASGIPRPIVTNSGGSALSHLLHPVVCRNLNTSSLAPTSSNMMIIGGIGAILLFVMLSSKGGN